MLCLNTPSTLHLLLVVVAAVLFSRLTSFQPGVVFGLVAGIACTALDAHRERAIEAMILADVVDAFHRLAYKKNDDVKAW